MKIINGNVLEVCNRLNNNSIRCIITSPPYYNVRNYGNENQIGLEESPEKYISQLVKVFNSLKHKMTDDGNLFVNLGDKYDKTKSLMLIPTLFAKQMIDDGWILRNKIIWYKPNHQPSPVKDRLTNTYEEIFHFVKNNKYYYDLDSTRIPFEQDKLDQEKCYLKFKNKINNNEDLSIDEKVSALKELDKLYSEQKINKDARLKFRNGTKKLFGGDESLSGRAKELNSKGYFFHCNNPLGKNMGDLLAVNIKSHKGVHEAVFPEELVEPLIKMGSAEGDTILDCFAGTGTTLRVANRLNRIGLGIELNTEYIGKEFEIV